MDSPLARSVATAGERFFVWTSGPGRKGRSTRNARASSSWKRRRASPIRVAIFLRDAALLGTGPGEGEMQQNVDGDFLVGRVQFRRRRRYGPNIKV